MRNLELLNYINKARIGTLPILAFVFYNFIYAKRRQAQLGRVR